MDDMESPNILANPLVPSKFFIRARYTKPGIKNRIVIRNTAESIKGDSCKIEPVSAFLNIPLGKTVAIMIITINAKADKLAQSKALFSSLEIGSSSTGGPSYLPKRGIDIFFATMYITASKTIDDAAMK